MANTYSKVYCQTVFAVKYRKAMIHDELKQKLFPVIGNLINEAGAQTIVVNGVEDHVHCLFRIFPKNSISEIMKVAKGKSSKWVNESGLVAHRFEWQSGFGAFSYSESDLHKVVKYIQNQEIHHRKVNFREEYLKLLIDFKVDFSPEYLFEDLV
jgi:REP element-mobilizing transposase RayT